MSRAERAWRRVDATIDALERWTVVAAMLVMSGAVFAAVAWRALTRVFPELPNAFVFSQRLALCLMIWVFMLGVSMATRRQSHLGLDILRKLAPVRWRPAHGRLSALVSAGFAGFLGWLGVQYTHTAYASWVLSDGFAGVFDSIPIPHWTVSLAIPTGFGLCAVRYAAMAVWPNAEATS